MGRKKGFWIKTNGMVAVDLTMSPRDAARLRKYKVRQKPIITAGKSTKEIKSVVIPEFKKRIAHEVRYRKFYRYFLTQVETKANAKVKESQIAFKKKIRSENTKWKHAQKNLMLRQVRKHAHELMRGRVVVLSNHNIHMLHATLGFPIILKFTRENDITPKELNTMVAMTYYTAFFCEDAITWGLVANETEFSRVMSLLRKKGYIESFRARRISHVLSVSGREYLKKFNQFYHKYHKQMIRKRK